jgi:uncharacterized OB-fold protein
MAESQNENKGPATRPIRPGLFVERGSDGRPKLCGSRCRETGEYFWPKEIMNPTTRKWGTLTESEIDGAGRIVSYTVVARGLPGFASPYALATIALDQGPTLIAQLEDWQGKTLAIGQRVELKIGVVSTDKDGTRVMGPKFMPLSS